MHDSRRDRRLHPRHENAKGAAPPRGARILSALRPPHPSPSLRVLDRLGDATIVFLSVATPAGKALILFEDGKEDIEKAARSMAERLEEQGRTAIVKSASNVEISESSLPAFSFRGKLRRRPFLRRAGARLQRRQPCGQEDRLLRLLRSSSRMAAHYLRRYRGLGRAFRFRRPSRARGPIGLAQGRAGEFLTRFAR